MIKYFDINEKGYSVKCKLYCNNVRDIDKVVIYGHGFGGHKDNKAAERFAETLLGKYKKVGVITFNLPCHGDDVKKKLVLEDGNDYLESIVKYIQSQWHTDKIYGYATSFGGYVFLKYILDRKNPFIKLALRCPAVNMYEVLYALLSQQEREQLEKGNSVAIGFDHKITITNSFLEELKENNVMEKDFTEYFEDILIIHGTKDEVVPIEPIATCADNNLSDFIPVENADHRFKDPALMGNAIKMILDFYKM